MVSSHLHHHFPSILRVPTTHILKITTGSRYPTFSRLETKPRPSPITNYPSLTASLMQAVKYSNMGKQVTRRQNMLWVEEGRGG